MLSHYAASGSAYMLGVEWRVADRLRWKDGIARQNVARFGDFEVIEANF